jgi:Spy/CpxP family protein refolding chaperone
MMGGGPEMMGGGPGMMGGGHMAVLAELPAEKREQVRKLHVATMQEMIAKRSFLPELELQLRNAMHAFPIDQAAAKKARADIARIREETFQLRLATMAQMQQIVGKETWEKMHRAGEPGAGHGPAMGPGAGMGPGR